MDCGEAMEKVELEKGWRKLQKSARIKPQSHKLENTCDVGENNAFPTHHFKLSPNIYFPFFLSEAYVSSLLCPISLYPAVLLDTSSILAMA